MSGLFRERLGWNNPSAVWFHTFTPKVEGGYRLDLVPSALVPRTGVWHRMNVVARGHAFQVFLSGEDGPLRYCAFRVDELTSVDA